MTPAEECRAQRDKLAARRTQYRTELKETTSPKERERLRAKIRWLGEAIRDVQVQLDHLEPPKERKARKVQRKRLDIGALSFDFFERNNIVWSDLEGHTWTQVQAGDFVELGASMEQLQRWMAEGSLRLTERQRSYLDAYYNEGLSLETIGARYGVNRPTVSRVIRNGLSRMQAWVDSKKMIMECSDGQGGFNWPRYLSQVPALTDRQRQLMLLVLSNCPSTKRELAEKLELDQSTVVRTLQLAGRTIQALGARGETTSRPKIQDWEHADSRSLCLQTDMPLYFYYRYCFRGQRVGGVSRYLYELSRRLEAGVSSADAAAELGLKPKTVQSAYSRIRRMGLHPGTGGDTLMDKLDAETYVRLQRMVTDRDRT